MVHLFIHNKHSNKRWDTRNHPFHENMLNGRLILDMNPSFESNFINELASMKTNLVQDKYDKK